MLVANILAVKGRDVATVSKERSVTDALAILRERRIGALVVTGPTAPLAGILSERDVVRALAERGASALEATVAELMSTEVTTCDETTSVTDLTAHPPRARGPRGPVGRHGVDRRRGQGSPRRA